MVRKLEAVIVFLFSEEANFEVDTTSIIFS